MKKKVLFKVVGSQPIGMGHVYRCLCLAKTLEKDFIVLFHVNNNIHVKELLGRHRVPYLVEGAIQEEVLKEGIDLVLFDQLSGDEGLFRLLKSSFPHLKIIALDYFDYDNEFVDIIINLHDQNLHESKPSINGIEYYEGLEYALIRDEFHKYLSQKKKIPAKVKNILITFGGADFKGNTEKALQLLRIEEVSNVNINIVLGPMWEGKVPESADGNIHIHRSISNMADYMFKADLAFCGAGTTMMELLSVGTPTIVIPQNHLEERFAIDVEHKGAIILFRSGNDEKSSIISNLLSSQTEREKLSRNGKLLIDGKGSERIYKIIQNALR